MPLIGSLHPDMVRQARMPGASLEYGSFPIDAVQNRPSQYGDRCDTFRIALLSLYQAAEWRRGFCDGDRVTG